MNPDMLAALQGGGGQSPMGGGGGAMPQDMMALLGGGGGAPPEDAAPAGALHSGSAAEGDPNENVMNAIDELTSAAQRQVDDELINVYTTCIANLQKTLAKQQSGADGMAAGKFDAASMRQMGAADEAY